MECEMCGRDARRLSPVRIEGTVLNVCRSCARLGEPVSRKARIQRRKREEKPIPETMLDPEFPKKIAQARELLKMSREDVARKARMSPSYLEKLETGKLKPTMEDAKKLEKVLGVSVIVEVKEKKEKPKKQEPKVAKPQKPKASGVLTLGEVANIIVKKS